MAEDQHQAPEGSIRYFVPGLDLTVTDEELSAYFSSFGEVVKAMVVKDKATDSSRGFGYVTMADASSRDVIVTAEHVLGGATVRALVTKDSLASAEALKVHLDGLSPDVSPDSLREAFSQFGVVLDVHRPKDFRTGDRKRFGFVTFGSQEGFQAALSAGQITVGGCEVIIKPAAQSSGGATKQKGKSMGKGWGGDPYTMGGKGYGGEYGMDASWSGKGSNGSVGGDEPVLKVSKKEKGIKYYVPGLDASVGDEQLKAHFTQYGEVLDAAVVVDKETQVSRGFGYVTMADDRLRDTILNATHEIAGRTTSVLLTKDSLTSSVITKVHIGKLREDITPETIRNAMANFGTVLDVHTPKDARTGQRHNYAFVTFSTSEACEFCLSKGTLTIEGCQVTLKPAVPAKEEAASGKSGGYGGCKGGYDAWGGSMKGFDPSWSWDMGPKGKGKGGADAWWWSGGGDWGSAPSKGKKGGGKGSSNSWGKGGCDGGGAMIGKGDWGWGMQKGGKSGGKGGESWDWGGSSGKGGKSWDEASWWDDGSSSWGGQKGGGGRGGKDWQGMGGGSMGKGMGKGDGAWGWDGGSDWGSGGYGKSWEKGKHGAGPRSGPY